MRVCKHTLIASSRRHTCRVAGLLLLCTGASLRAQDTRKTALYGAGARTSCLDSLPASVFKRVVVYTFVEPRDSASDTFIASAEILLQDAVIRVQRMLGKKEGVLPRGDSVVNWREVDAPLGVVAHRDGRITWHLPSTTFDHSAAALLGEALDSVSTPESLSWATESGRDSIAFDFAFSRPTLDSDGHFTPPHPKRTAIALLSIPEPGESIVSLVPGQRPPSYPEEPRRNFYEATIILSFIVDTAGRAVDSTVHDVWPKDKPRPRATDMNEYERFVLQSKLSVLRYRFMPARIGGCPTNQLVQMPFVYQLNR